ncbi:MAG: hypothetical protein ACLGHT_06185 [Acidimicrobiia bacterium]
MLEDETGEAAEALIARAELALQNPVLTPDDRRTIAPEGRQTSSGAPPTSFYFMSYGCG